jgi:hypothetical protein
MTNTLQNKLNEVLDQLEKSIPSVEATALFDMDGLVIASRLKGGVDDQRIAGDLCRICPKGVGGAEIKGSFCPIPNFIAKLVNLMLGREVLALESEGIQKENTACVTVFQGGEVERPISITTYQHKFIHGKMGLL